MKEMLVMMVNLVGFDVDFALGLTLNEAGAYAEAYASLCKIKPEKKEPLLLRGYKGCGSLN